MGIHTIEKGDIQCDMCVRIIGQFKIRVSHDVLKYLVDHPMKITCSDCLDWIKRLNKTDEEQ